MPPETGPRPRSRGWVRLLVVFIVAFDVAAFFQWADGAYQSEFGGHPDEAANYVNAVRVRDAAAGFGQTSAFNVAQGAWMLIFGTSRISALLFMAALAAATTALIFGTVRREFGDWAAVVASVLWLCAPAVRESYETILPGILGALFFTVAVLLWARVIDKGSPRIATFGRWLGFAILLGGVCVLAFALAVSLKLQPGDPGAAAHFLKECAFLPGIAITAFALAGIAIPGRSAARAGTRWIAMGALVAAVFCARWNKAGVPDLRILIVATPALAMLATRGAVLLAGIIGSRTVPEAEAARRKALWLLLLLLLALSPNLLQWHRKEWHGFGPIAATFVEEAHGPVRVLVVSDPRGEGMLISEIAMRDRASRITVERGSETLVESGGPEPRVRPPERFLEDEQLLAYLSSGKVRYIVLDSAVPVGVRAGYHDQVLRVIESDVRSFWPIYDSPIIRDGEPMGHPLRVFRVHRSDGVQLE